MKNQTLLLSALIQVLSVTAIASQPLVSNQRAPDVVAAIRCGTGQQWRLLETYTAKKNGTYHPEDRFLTEEEAYQFMHEQASLLNSPDMGTAIYSIKSRLDEKLDYRVDGFFDAPSLGLPVQIDGCQVAPIAVNIEGLFANPKKPLMLNKAIYDSLEESDRWFLRMQLNQVPAEIMMTYFDSRISGMSVLERLQFLTKRKFVSFFYGSVNIDTKADTMKVVDNQIRKAQLSTAKGNAQVTFFPTGQLRSMVRTSSGQPYLYARQKIVPGQQAIYDYPGSSGMQFCDDSASYNERGELIQCNGHLLGPDFKPINSAEVQTFHTGKSYEIRYNRIPEDILIVDRLDTESQVANLLQLRKTAKTIYVVSGALACRQIGFKNTADGSYNKLEITIPKGCVGLAKIVWNP